MGGANLMQVIRARTLLPRHDLPAINDAGLVVHDGLVVDLGPFSEIRRSYVGPDVDVDGLLVPGFVDAHSHLRGTPLDAHGIESMPLEPWLCALTSMTSLPASDEALLAAGALLRTGVTTVQAMVHCFDDAPGFVALATDVARSLSVAGVRSLLILGLTDQAEFAPEPRDARHEAMPSPYRGVTPAEFMNLVAAVEAELAAGLDGLGSVGVGPVAAQWSTDAALQAIARAGVRRRIHSHLNESPLQRDWLRTEAAPVERLHRHALLGGSASMAHGVDLSAEELQTLAASGTSLVHCPTSNSRLSVGTARVGDWIDSGINAALGLDSHDDGVPDFFAEMRAAIELSRETGRVLSPAEVFAMATTGGAVAVGDERLGRLVPGGVADASEILVEAGSGLEVEDLVSSGSAAAVRNVWVAGQHVLRDGVTRSEEEENRARERTRELLHRDQGERDRRQREIQPALRQAYGLWEGQHDRA